MSIRAVQLSQACDAAPSSPGAERILRAAISAFATYGFDGATVRKIAREASVDPALVNHLFGSKDALWRAAVLHVSTEVQSALAGLHDNEEANLATAIRGLIEMSANKPAFARFVLAEIGRQGERFDFIFEYLVNPIYELIDVKMSDNQDEGMDRNVGFFALAGAIATAVVTRPFAARMSAAITDKQFVEQLNAIVTPLLPSSQTQVQREN